MPGGGTPETLRLRRGLTLLLGGARSGKSDLAVQLGHAWHGEVILAATATAGDDDMAMRIERHQHDRPHDWGLIEAPYFGADEAALVPEHALLIVDCLTMLVANLVFADRCDTEIDAHAVALADVLANRTAPTLVVSNEVGLGVHPESELGRRYRDLLGRVNRRVGTRSDDVLFVAAGRATRLEHVEASW